MAEVECRDCYDFKTHRYKYLKERVIVDGRPVVRECPGGDHYTYGDIFYCRQQIIWIISHLEKLKRGVWPDMRGVWPDMPGVVTAESIKKKQAEAHFARACITAADVEYRLKKTKGDGKLLKKEIELGAPINEMDGEAESALLWCEGWRKRRGDYAVWKAKRFKRQRDRNIPKGG